MILMSNFLMLLMWRKSPRRNVMGGNQTTVTVVALGGAAAAIVMWLMDFFLPGLMMSAPAGLEAAITTILVALLGYFLPFDGTKPEDKP